jgi:hypothetical protein
MGIRFPEEEKFEGRKSGTSTASGVKCRNYLNAERFSSRFSREERLFERQKGHSRASRKFLHF